jgi:uncharacterized membrane protein
MPDTPDDPVSPVGSDTPESVDVGGGDQLSDEDLASALTELIIGSEDSESDSIANVVVSRKFSGPLPPPAVLEGYEATLRGAADRILRMAEKQQDHSVYMDKRVTRQEFSLGITGLVFAFVLALAVLAASVWLISEGKGVEGTVLATLDLVALATAFIVGRPGRPSN